MLVDVEAVVMTSLVMAVCLAGLVIIAIYGLVAGEVERRERLDDDDRARRLRAELDRQDGTS